MNEKKARIALLIVALGLWLIALPLTYGYKAHPVEVSDIVCGLLFVIFGLFSLAPKRAWPGWAVGIVGLWLQLAPLVFWAPYALMYVNDTLVGAIAIAFAFLINKKETPANSPECPLGWSYNPSSWSHRIPTIALAMFCWFFSRYMSAYQLGYIDHMWDPFFTNGTLSVITSKISHDFPVSDAGLGALCYTLEFLLGWQGGSRRWYRMPWLVFTFAFLVIPVGMVSVMLIILQPVAVGAWCSWCLATAALMLCMIVLTAGELAGVLQFLKEVHARGDSVWRTFWKGGAPDQDAKPVEPWGRRPCGALGITLPWNLMISIGLGIWLMLSPWALNSSSHLAVTNYIEGPMIVALSVIALAESFRALRLVNVLLGLALILFPWFIADKTTVLLWNNLIAGILIILLSLRKGKIVERYGAWEKLIR
jgi:hypothetical protein